MKSADYKRTGVFLAFKALTFASLRKEKFWKVLSSPCMRVGDWWARLQLGTITHVTCFPGL